MQVKKITAKIRDMVKVSLMENGDERTWYNNIELPDEIKDLEMKDFRFNVLMDGKIEFQITFEPGILPKNFPEKKSRNRRTAPVAATTPPVAPATMPIVAKDSTPAIVTKDSDKAVTPAPAPAPKATVKEDAKAAAPVQKPAAKATKPETKPDAKVASKKAI